MRPTMAPEVAEHLGEAAERHLAEAEVGVGMCRDCSQPIETSKEASSLVLLISDPDEAPGELTALALTHATCSGSEVRHLPRAELRNYLDADDHPAQSVSAMSAILQLPGGPVRPVLFVSNHGEVTLVTDDGLRIDGTSAALFDAGWEQVTQVQKENPIARVETQVRFTPIRTQQPFVLGRLVLSTGLSVMADLELAVHPIWVQLVAEHGQVAVYSGRLSIQHWTGIDWDRIDREIEAGLLAGAMLPADMIL
ncbi:hypothetical protein ACQPXM_41200 (plasmid) [Kribbella sp. CA-253562]|uniref:hypothetical protein n=1 Tax=Kribbella sp. CA-253562 TaxID=3239942 RepID=UPI003D8F7958